MDLDIIEKKRAASSFLSSGGSVCISFSCWTQHVCMHSQPYLIQSHTQLCHDAAQQNKLASPMASGSCRAMEKVHPLCASWQRRGDDKGWDLTCSGAFGMPSVSGCLQAS